jgi:D-glycero-D-manno-heptose 1,7-bisphosphate phosphatase
VKLLILGRDGILNEYREDHVKSPEEWVPIRGALEALSRLNHAGMRWWPPTRPASGAA